MTDPEPLRVLIADDHPVMRDGLRAVLTSLASADVCGEATTGDEAIALSSQLQPDVVVMDLQMPGLNGIEATRRIVTDSPHVAVLVLTMFDDDESVFMAMRAGARGYLVKGADGVDIARAVDAVRRGDAIFGPAVARRVLDFFGTAARPAGQFTELTRRENEVLLLIARGESNTAISERLFLSPKTVRNHVSNIFSKMQVADRAQAIVRARDAGIGEPPNPRSDRAGTQDPIVK